MVLRFRPALGTPPARRAPPLAPLYSTCTHFRAHTNAQPWTRNRRIDDARRERETDRREARGRNGMRPDSKGTITNNTLGLTRQTAYS